MDGIFKTFRFVRRTAGGGGSVETEEKTHVADGGWSVETERGGSVETEEKTHVADGGGSVETEEKTDVADGGGSVETERGGSVETEEKTDVADGGGSVETEEKTEEGAWRQKRRRTSRWWVEEWMKEKTWMGGGEFVHVAAAAAVGQDMRNLVWVLRNTPGDKKIVIVHVLPCPGLNTTSIIRSSFDVPQREDLNYFQNMEQKHEYAYHQKLRFNECTNDLTRQAENGINTYVQICADYKFHAETLLIESDDIAKGLVDLIAQHRITSLVMGAAADKHYSEVMKEPKSRTALTVQEQADPSCNITFLCKGNLICTREAGVQLQRFMIPSSSETNLSSTTNQSDYIRPGSPQLPEGNFLASQEGTLVSQSASSSHRYSSESNGTAKDEEESLAFYSLASSPHNESEDIGVGNDMYEQLKKNALIEVRHLKCEAPEESRWRQKAERDFVEATQKAKAAESLHIKEMKLKETEEKLAREKAERERLRKEHEQILIELKNANEQKLKLEIHVANRDNSIKEFEAKVSEAYSIQEQLRQDVRKYQKERDEAVKEAEELRKEKEETTLSMQARVAFSEFTYSELEEATNNFDKSLMIGEGGYGKVYKGFLRHTVVAIKKLNPESVQGGAEFNQEVDILSRVRHPNLVTLIGACPEVRALVYEFLPNKSLEARLKLKDPRHALTWQARMRIAGEICTALIFLHSAEPQCIVHGDLKPDNILLDTNYVSKLGDFGICRLLDQSSTAMTAYYQTDAPKGTFSYMDPEYLSSGELTLQSDVYSFGIVLLRLITGKGPLKIRNEVQEALQKGWLKELLDTSAGEWPFEVEAKELVYLGVNCCDPTRKKRPELAAVWRMLRQCQPSSYQSDLA